MADCLLGCRFCVWRRDSDSTLLFVSPLREADKDSANALGHVHPVTRLTWSESICGPFDQPMINTFFLLLFAFLPNGAKTDFRAESRVATDYYKLSGVRRVDQDLYKTNDGVIVQTQYCYHYTYGEEAILKWEGQYSYNNKIIWKDDSKCDVKSILKG